MARYSTRPAVKTKSSATKSTTTTTTTRIPVITSQSGRDSLKSSQSIEGGRLLTPGIAKGLSIFSSIPTINTKYHTKIFTGNEGATLQDIVFCNLSTDALTLNIFVSTIDIDAIDKSGKTFTQVNDSLTGSVNTCQLLNLFSLAANSSNTLSAAVGGLLNPLVGSSLKFYVYCTKASSDGILDVTVLK
tara:strand:- start:2182 stop:2745 length:564 start_codon:yes stop_codon:yes gene_type:complete